MEKSLYEIIRNAKDGDSESILEIVERFKPLTCKYSRYLKYEDASRDLMIKLLEVIENIPIGENFKKDKQITSYLGTAIRNEYIRLSKKNKAIMNTEIFLDENIISIEQANTDERIFVKNLLETLPTNQKKILIYKFIRDYSDVQIASKLEISRQAVNKTKNRALKNLKQYIEEQCMVAM